MRLASALSLLGVLAAASPPVALAHRHGAPPNLNPAALAKGSIKVERELQAAQFGADIVPLPHGAFDVRDMATIDVDGDGDLDMVIVSWGAPDKVLINDGSGTFTPFNLPSGTGMTVLAAADFTGDGKVDLITWGHDSSKVFKFYINDGLGNGSTTHPFNSDPVEVPALVGLQNIVRNILPVDIDNDGDMDLVITSYGTYNNKLFLNDGSGSFSSGIDITSGTQYAPAADGTFRAHAADLNKDGCMDLVLSNCDSGQHGSKVALNRCDGTNTFTEHGVPASVNTCVSATRVIDLDGDGNLDLVHGDLSNHELKVFYGSGDPTYTTTSGVVVIPDFPGDVYDVDFADMNGDGLLDIIAIRYNPSIEIPGGLFINHGDRTYTQYAIAITDGLVHGHNYYGCSGDLNGDNKIDFPISSEVSGFSPKVYFNQGLIPASPNAPPAVTEPPTPQPTSVPTTASPTSEPTKSPTSEPTSQPTNAPTYKAAWNIAFDGLSANFSSTSDKELTLNYKIGKGRAFVTSLYKDCTKQIITGITITPSNETLSYNGTHDELKITYDMDKTAIALSNIWNANTSKIELCQVVQLTETGTNGTEMIISEDVRDIDIDFNLTVDYTTNTNLADGTINNASDSTNVSSSVEACRCSADSENCLANTDLLGPNTELHVCVKSIDPAIKVDQLETMILTQGATTFDAVLNGTAEIESITKIEYLPSPSEPSAVRVSTRVPINTFNFEAGESLTVSGGILMKLVGSSRKLRVLVGDAAANADPNEASYEVLVELKDEADLFLEDEVPIGNSGPTKVKELAVLGVALLASYLAW